MTVEEIKRLNAAAPALLDALQKMLKCIEADWGADFIPYNLAEPADAQANEAVLAARAAIALATKQ